ncbi:MAG: hypothetical protein IT379_10605 [Deltaproteobacteria bacterium]|nr:hypothetical protein [Deltaproteobacteria bacterium]
MNGTDETSSEPRPAPSTADGPAPSVADGLAETDEEWRTPGRHYLAGLGCFGLVVLAVVGFYLWRVVG